MDAPPPPIAASSASAVPATSPDTTSSFPDPASSSSPPLPSLNSSLARDASSFFQSSRFHDCLDVLHRLQLRDPDNPKVFHNIAVAEYFRDGCTDLQKLLHTFLKTKKMIDELSKNTRDQLNKVNESSLSNSTTMNSLNSKASSGSNAESLSSVSLDDYDTSISSFNIAVVMFYLHHFTTALSILEPLYHNIGSIDEPAALLICTLMLDIALASSQLDKACDVLQYMEKSFGWFLVTPSESGSSVQSYSLLGTTDSSSSTGVGAATGDSSASNMTAEASLTRSSSEEAFDDDGSNLSVDIDGSISEKPVISDAERVAADRLPSAPARDSSIKVMLHLNKARLFLCTRNIRAAKREIKLAINLAQGSDLLKASMLKAQLDWLRGNYRKALKLLMTCSTKDPGLRYMIFNNLGCIHHYLGKGNTSNVYFLKALQVSSFFSVEKPLRLSNFSQNRSSSILYNCGLQHLKNNNPVLAAQCFQQAGLLYHRQPLFWLRLAECCISALEVGSLGDCGFDYTTRKDALKVHSAGSGRLRTLFLPSGSMNPSLSNAHSVLKLDSENSMTVAGMRENGTDSFGPGKMHKLSLVFGRQCLKNAMHLIGSRMRKRGSAAVDNDAGKDPEDVSQDLKNLSISSSRGSVSGFQSNSNGNNKEGKANSINIIGASLTAFKEDQKKRDFVVLLHILADLAFIELCLDNPISALKAAQEIVEYPECTKPFKFLGRVYAAEALCMLNRAREALDELSTCMAENTSLETPSNADDEDGQQWRSGENSDASGEGDDGISTAVANTATLSDALSVSSLTGTRARASLFVNLAMVHAMLGNNPQAQQFAMQAVSITPANPLAVLSAVYVNLVQGRTQEALAILKHCRLLCIVS